MDLSEDGLLVAFQGVYADVELRKDGLVHQAALLGVGVHVGLVAAPDERQGLIEGLLGLLGFVVGGGEPALGLGALGADALLLDLEHVFVDAVAVEGLKELLLLVLKLS